MSFLDVTSMVGRTPVVELARIGVVSVAAGPAIRSALGSQSDDS